MPTSIGQQQVQLFSGNDDLRKQYQQRFPFILIDEYQDTNTAQYQMVRLLGEKSASKRTIEPGDVALIVGEFSDFLENALETGEDELSVIELE